jgi:hypothetical protein
LIFPTTGARGYLDIVVTNRYYGEYVSAMRLDSLGPAYHGSHIAFERER